MAGAFFKANPAIAVYFQIGSAFLTADMVAVDRWTPQVGMLVTILLLATLWVFSCFADELAKKGYPRSWAYLSLLSIFGLIVLWVLPTRPVPPGFPVEQKQSSELKQ